MVADFGFKKLKRIYAAVFLKNKSSARVLQKNGFKLEGIMEKYYFKSNKYSDVLLYAKIK